MVKLVISSVFMAVGLFFMLVSTIGVNKFKRALNRMHAAAVGDTLGLLFTLTGLVIWKGFSFVSLKLLSVIIFFWLASPVASHMISRLEAEIDDDLGEIEVISK